MFGGSLSEPAEDDWLKAFLAPLRRCQRLRGRRLREAATVEEIVSKIEVKSEPGEEEEAKGLVRLNLGAPYDVAKTFIKRAVTEEGERRYAFIGRLQGELVRKPTLWFWKGEFYRWNGQCYETVETDEIRAQVYDFLDRAIVLDGTPLKPKPKNVNEVIDGLKAGTNLGTSDVPVWIGIEGRPEPKRLLACRNGLLEFGTGKLWDHDPRFFSVNSVDFDDLTLGLIAPDGNVSLGRFGPVMGKWLRHCKSSSGCG